jgi:hypothetical protein
VPCVPLAKEVVLTLSGVPAADTVILSAFVAPCAVGLVASVTSTVTLNVPEVVGVPERTPVDAANVNPEGNDPARMLQR